MIDQLDLFGPGARNTDPVTSHLAAKRTPNVKANDRRMVLLIHDNNPAGLTDFELAARANRQQTSLGKRRGELRDAGLIVQTAGRRPAPSGASAIVWQITPEGRDIADKLRRLA